MFSSIRRAGRIAAAAALLLGIAASARADDATEAAAVSVERGKALFDGTETLSGRIRGHIQPLPATLSACASCHQPIAPQPVASNAPSLDPASLLTPTSRRNGPPSAYDQETFCRVLASGVDPVHIVLPRTMPEFTMSPQQCESLWRYLTDRKTE